MSVLKPKIVDFVEAGMAAIKTPEFSIVIQNAFKNDGMFEKIRADAAALGPIVAPVASGEGFMQSLMDSINEIDELGNNVLALLDDPNDDVDVREDIYSAEPKEDGDDEESDSDDNDE
jgi:hypothetical protein